MSIQHWKEKYLIKTPITLLTAYDATMARLIEIVALMVF